MGRVAADCSATYDARQSGFRSEVDEVSPRQQLLPAGLKVERKDIEGEPLQALGHVSLDELLPLP